MPTNKSIPPAIEGIGILVEGFVLTPIVVLDLVVTAISAYFKNAKPENFDSFFKSGLYFSDVLAKNLTFRYLACADAFGYEPGLGATRGGLNFTLASVGSLQSELKKLGVGKFAGDKLDLKLSEFLRNQKSSVSAKSALTPAKRDALIFEARKLLSVPPEAFSPYVKSRYSAVGVRG